MSCIKFKLTFELRELLLSVSRKDDAIKLKGLIEQSLDDDLVPYSLIKSLYTKEKYDSMDDYLMKILKGSEISFKNVRKVEPEAVRQARLFCEEKLYNKMVGRINESNTVGEMEEWKKLKRLFASVMNVTLSVFGAAVVAFYLARKSLSFSVEISLVLALLVGQIVLLAEMFLVARRELMNGLI